MNLPVIPTPVFPRWVWMEEVTYSHIPIATFITAAMVLAPIFEYIGYRRDDLRFDRLAKSLIFFSLILFSPGAALGTGIPMIIIGLYPEFWARWSNLFFWPLVAQFVFFTLEVIFLFLLYYLTWDRLMKRKPLHITFGVLAAIWGLAVQFVWDSLGAYMMTPSVPFPSIAEPVAWSAQAFFNPSFPYLFLHRFFGNISYVMLLVGGVFALKYMRQKDPTEKAYFGFASDVTFSIGFLAFFAMPFIGWYYARVLQADAPVAFHAIMGGQSASKFIVKMSMIAVFVIIGGTYMFVRHRRKKIMLGVITAVVASLYIILMAHPSIGWFGGPVAWRVITTLILAGFLAYLWGVHRTRIVFSTRKWPWFMFVAGMAAFVAFALGGFIRERAKRPWTVTDYLVKPEVLDWEADEALFYQKCFMCHEHRSPEELTELTGVDWAARIATERQRPGVNLTDEEADRIVRYLEGQY